MTFRVAWRSVRTLRVGVTVWWGWSDGANAFSGPVRQIRNDGTVDIGLEKHDTAKLLVQAYAVDRRLISLSEHEPSEHDRAMTIRYG